MVILGLERFDQFQEIVTAHEHGQVAETVMWGACPTQFDASQAPAGCHTAFMWEKVPYAIGGEARNWESLAPRHAQRLLKLWTDYAPNLAEAVLDSFWRTPVDTEQSLPNMQAGDLLVGSFADGQVGENRPFAGAGRYRTAIDGLYLCGGSTHPGGNITGLCGYNAARVIAADLQCPLWWQPPDAEEALRSLPEVRMSVSILHGDIHLIDLATRLPFKYGIATMTRAPQAFVRLVLEVDGREVRGIAADLLPPRWFTKNPEQTLNQEISEMLQVIEHAVGRAVGLAGETVFDIWRELAEIQHVWGREQGFPPLLSQFGTTLVERALIEGFCRAAGNPFAQCLRSNALGVRLEHFDQRLRGRSVEELLPREPRRRITARHTVGMADHLEESEIDPAARLADGLPQSLDQCIRYYGLRHFKLKLSGTAGPDVERLNRIVAVIERSVSGSYAFTLDGNESFRSLDGFREYWSSISRAPGLERLLSHMMFVEQPFHRDVALDAERLGNLSAWAERPSLIIDESDAEIDSLSRALAIGYHGTSHKNCKGVFKGVANACLLALLRRDGGDQRLVMSGEDLANIGPVALLQDLAVVASLGVASVERNGHHYFAGLSAFPRDIHQHILKHHSDLYQPATQGWPTLRIADGELALDSVVDAPLGVGFELDVTQFTPAKDWRDLNLSKEIQP